jgi:hypothetical protein
MSSLRLESKQLVRIDREQFSRPAVRGLDVPLPAHEHDPIGGGVEDLRQPGLLGAHRLVVVRVIHGDGRVVGQRREELGLFDENSWA